MAAIFLFKLKSNRIKHISPQVKISEEELIDRLKAQDTEALNYLYDHYSAALYGTILRIVRTEEVAQEVLHDAFLRIWEKINQYQSDKGRLFTWMVNLARNLSIDKVRSKEIKNTRKTDKVEDNVGLIDRSKNDHMAVDGIGIREVVAKLPKDLQLIIELMYFQGYTQSEISEEYEIPLGTVKTRTRSAMQALRKLVQ